MKDMPTVFVLTVNGAVTGVYMEKSAAIRDRDINRRASTPMNAVIATVKDFKVRE